MCCFFPSENCTHLSLAFLWLEDEKNVKNAFQSQQHIFIIASNKLREGRVTFQTEAINLLFWSLAQFFFQFAFWKFTFSNISVSFVRSKLCSYCLKRQISRNEYFERMCGWWCTMEMVVRTSHSIQLKKVYIL